MCLFMVPSCPKVLKQIWHSWSLTFSWTCKIWFRKRWWSGKYLRQTPHFDPYLTLYSSGWHSRKWVFRSVNLVKSLGQTSHGKCFFILRRSFFKDLLCGKIFLECFRLRKMWRKISSWRQLCLQFFKRGPARQAERLASLAGYAHSFKIKTKIYLKLKTSKLNLLWFPFNFIVMWTLQKGPTTRKLKYRHAPGCSKFWIYMKIR